MLSFLNSAVLIAAVAALIPLLIHLFSKRRVKIIEFSSLKHLKAMQKRQVRRLKIRQLLLLILRMLIILAVVFAFARPTSTGGQIGSHASVSAVILFDNSASMNREVTDGNLFEIARHRAQQLLGTFGESDQIALILLDNSDSQQEDIRFTSPAIVKEKLKLLQPKYGSADFERALDAAQKLLAKASNLNKEIYIISDRQQHSLPDNKLSPDKNTHIFIVDLPLRDNDNCGLTSVDLGGQLLVPGKDFDITATVKNYGSLDREDIIASLFLDNRRVAQTDVRVKAGQDATIRFTQNLTRGGFHSGYIELSDDMFPADNRYYFSFHIPEKFNVLIVDGDGSGHLMALALAPSPSVNQYWSVKEVTPDNISQVNFSNYDVIIMAGAPSLPSSYHNRILSYVKRGKALFLTYGGNTDTASFNRQWAEVSGVVIDQPTKKNFTRAGYYTFQTFNVNHPIFSVFSFEKDSLPEIKFYTLPKAHTLNHAQVLALFSGNRPALVQTTYGSGKVLTFVGPISPYYGDLTSHAFFVPFVARIAEYLTADLSHYDLTLYTGSQITRIISMKGSFRTSLKVTMPNGDTYSVPPEEDNGVLIVKPRPTDLPGIYRIDYIGREIDRFAVNLEPTEGDLTWVDLPQFAVALGISDYRVLDPRQDIAVTIAEMRFGKELWHIFLWAALFLLAAEMLLSRSTTGEEE